MSAARPPEGARTAAEGEGVPSLAAPGRRFIDIQGVAQNFKTARGLFPALRDIH
ncbi:ABC transporter ATP-binding protein, partial [Verminephrobacter eiseniae]|nr:ABC transporter ATP-binding protein [Verminephrobacter eiseniae]